LIVYYEEKNTLNMAQISITERARHSRCN